MEQQPEESGTGLFQLNLDMSNSYLLRNAASWGKVLGIASIILGALLAILGILVQASLSKMGDGRYYGDEEMPGSAQLAGTLGMLLYVLMGLIIAVGGIFALNFGNRIDKAIKLNDQNLLNGGFSACRNFFAFWSILTIISLLFTLIGLAGLASQV